MRDTILEPGRRATALWLLAGLDPSGGAGLLRDAWTARACAPTLPIARLVTAWTRQGFGRVARVETRAADAVAAELQTMPPPRAVKIGLLPAPLVDVVLREVAARGAPVVLDPVLVASDGGRLSGAAEALTAAIAALADASWLITPNLDEARALTGDPRASLSTLARRMGRASVLLKDGHGEDPSWVRDYLCLSGHVHEFARARLPGPSPRGTGCALATAIACGLAAGRSLPAAVASAVAWLDAARQRCAAGPDGRPHLPRDAPALA